MFLQQRLMATGPTDPNQMTEQQQSNGEHDGPCFHASLLPFPFYWLSSMLLGMGERWWMQKLMKSDKDIELKVKKVK